MLDDVADGRAALIRSLVNRYDDQWLVDHETTVSMWDYEMADILFLAAKVERPIYDESVALDIIHQSVHELITAQELGASWSGADIKDLFRMTAVLVLYEAIALTTPGFRDGGGPRWEEGEPCLNLVDSNRDLMIAKNRQYGSSWSVLRSSDMTGTIHAKIHRISELMGGEENTFEPIEDGYRDILNYLVFCLIRLSMEIGEAECDASASVISEVSAERQRQKRDLYDTDFDDQNTINDWIAYVCRYASDAEGFVDGTFHPSIFRSKMLKAAAIAVAAVETYDRLDGNMAPRHYDRCGWHDSPPGDDQ
jgi:hypothetical protein